MPGLVDSGAFVAWNPPPPVYSIAYGALTVVRARKRLPAASFLSRHLSGMLLCARRAPRAARASCWTASTSRRSCASRSARTITGCCRPLPSAQRPLAMTGSPKIQGWSAKPNAVVVASASSTVTSDEIR